MLNHQDCILPMMNTPIAATSTDSLFSKELFALLTSDDIMTTLCNTNLDATTSSTANNLNQNSKLTQTNPCNKSLDESIIISSNMLTPVLSPLTEANISHSSDTHSSPNPSSNNYQSNVAQSPLLKMLQQSLSPSSQYSPITMFSDEQQTNNHTSAMEPSLFSPLSKTVTATCYQLIDEALKDTQSSLGLIWSKFDSNITTMDQPVTATTTVAINSTTNNIDIFPFNLDSATLDMLTYEKKKNLKRKQSNIENNLPPSKKQSITYEILPMLQQIPSPQPIQRPSPQPTKPTTDRRRKYKVRFGPNMFDEISVKKNHKLSPEVVVRK